VEEKLLPKSSDNHSHHQDNVTAPHGRTNLRSQLHFCHAQEGRPQSPQGHVGALDTGEGGEIKHVIHRYTQGLQCNIIKKLYKSVLLIILTPSTE